jgi:hypothetical protein
MLGNLYHQSVPIKWIFVRSEFKQVHFYTAFFFKVVMQQCSVTSSFDYSHILMTGWDLEAKVRSLTHYDDE